MSASVDRRHFTRFVNGLIMKNFHAHRIFKKIRCRVLEARIDKYFKMMRLRTLYSFVRFLLFVFFFLR